MQEPSLATLDKPSYRLSVLKALQEESFTIINSLIAVNNQSRTKQPLSELTTDLGSVLKQASTILSQTTGHEPVRQYWQKIGLMLQFLSVEFNGQPGLSGTRKLETLRNEAFTLLKAYAAEMRSTELMQRQPLVRYSKDLSWTLFAFMLTSIPLLGLQVRRKLNPKTLSGIAKWVHLPPKGEDSHINKFNCGLNTQNLT